MSTEALEEVLWVEKYRPKSLSDVVDQEDIISTLKEFVEKKNIPNMLFSGPPGIGKTATALALAQDLYGENWRVYTLELNASDERGIDMVRTTLKNYARTRVMGEIPFKIIILDEADMMTSEAQHALRRTMEKFADISRFILICNYPSKIIEPIQSRCAVFRFKKLTEEAVKKRLMYIAEKEGVDLKEDGLHAIFEISEGDLRKAINLLQSVAYLDKPVTRDLVYKTAGVVYPERIENLIKTAFKGDFETARKMLLSILTEEGVAGSDLIREVYSAISRDIISLNVDDKIRLIELIGEIDFRISQGATDYVQISSLLALLSDLGKKYKSK